MLEPLIIKKFYSFKARHAQITTFFVVMLGVLILLITIAVDLSQVAINKTSMDVAVDGSASYLGSILTSHAKSLSDKVAEGKAHHTESGGFFTGWLGEIVAWIVLIVLIIVSIFFAPAWYVTVAFAVAMGAVAWGISEIYRRQAIMEAFGDYIQMLNSTKDTYRESMLFSTIAAVANDPVKITDVRDVNRDGNTTEWVSRFLDHYQERLRLLVIEQGDQEGLEVMVSDILGTLDALIHGSNNLLDFRNFAKGDLWELFSNIDTPGYDALGLSSAIAGAEAFGYFVQARVQELASDPPPGYEVDSDIWVEDHPHAEFDDNLPPDPPWNDTTLCQISLAIYETYYSGEGGFASLTARVGELLALSVSEMVELINGDSEELFLSEIEDLCSELEAGVSAIDEWIIHLGQFQIPIDDDVQVLEAEIANLMPFIAPLEQTIANINTQIALLNAQIAALDPVVDAVAIAGLEAEISVLEAASAPIWDQLTTFQDLLTALQGVKDYLEVLETDIETAKSDLNDYKEAASDRQSNLMHLVSAIRNYVTPIASKVGKGVYAWEDTKGWHIVKVYVGSELQVPVVKRDTDKKWNKTITYIWVTPYASKHHNTSGQKVIIQARRFDEPTSTPWWDFYPSGRYDEEEWGDLTADFEVRFVNGGGFIVEGEPLYMAVDNFMESYGVKAESKSSTCWANRQNDRSRWRISIADPQ